MKDELLLQHQVTHPLFWQQLLEARGAELRELCLLTLRETLGDFPPCEISSLWTDDATIQGHNRDFRGKDRPTNVLSFPSYPREELPLALRAPPSVPLPLGDLVFAYETIEKEAEQEEKPLFHHISHLMVHGLLHLLGYDHETEEEALLMEEKEGRILEQRGIPNPYAPSEAPDSLGCARGPM